MSKETHLERKLAAVFAADVEGFSRLIEADEVGTLQNLSSQRSILDDLIARYRGRVANTAGDSVLAEFPSVADAVQCAVETQKAHVEAAERLPVAKRVLFRIGIHLGDVAVRGNDLLGNGVNIAARLQAIAPAGGIVISGGAHEQVHKILPLTFNDLGAQTVKNIEQPVRAFAIELSGNSTTAAVVSFPTEGKSLSLPDKPSIAVLPFQNMSGDPEQEYFADGMVEDIITALSRFKSLFVIARNSSFAYKGKSPDVRQVGRELGVRYVLEGSVRKAGVRVRITGQLIDTTSGAHIWADRFEGSLGDAFALQDDVTQKVVVAIAPRVEQADIARVRRTPPANADAYDCYLRGLANLYPLSAETIERSLSLFNEATALDPGYSAAYGMAMYCRACRVSIGRANDMAREQGEVARLWQAVLRVGQDDALALSHCGHAIAQVLRQLAPAKQLIERALELNPNLASAWLMSGWINIWGGSAEVALEHLSRAERLDPFSPVHFPARAHAWYFLGRYEEALEVAEQGLRHHPQAQPVLRIGAASAAMAGRIETAHSLADRFRRLDPAFRVSRLGDYLGAYQKPEFVQTYAKGLRLAGLPE